MSLFTRRNYEFLAATFREIRLNFAGVDRLVVEEVIEEFADALAEESLAFNRPLFITKTGMNTSETNHLGTRNDRPKNDPS